MYLKHAEYQRRSKLRTELHFMRRTDSITDSITNGDRPQICSEAGLACETCVSATAHQLAMVCKGLKGKMIGQLFVQIYTEPSCARMHGQFAEAYRSADCALAQPKDAVADAPSIRKPVTPAYERREVTFARPRSIAAVA
jgi:hypothetical protein